VAAAGKDIVGHLAITREEHPATSHIASLGLGVSPDWRGRGLGAALVAAALAWARDVGVRKVILTVYPDNLPAVNLYRKFGFIEEGRFLRHSLRDGEYRDEILMGRWLE
jgi:putative acetyltransferase